jgi:hypothetical protein
MDQKASVRRTIRMRTEAHPAEGLQSSVVKINAYSRVAKEPDVGRHFPEFAYPLRI